MLSHRLSRILLDEFERLGLERTFESLTIKEINELTKSLIEIIEKVKLDENDPPF